MKEPLFVNRAKEWLEHASTRPYALWLLAGMAFIEGSIFPLPPDLLFLPLSLMRPRRAFVFASVCVAGSVAGALGGYLIGAALYETVGQTLITLSGFGSRFTSLLAEYQKHALITLLLAGFTNIPFSLFTIAAGFRHTLTVETLLIGAAIGRAVRFYLLGAVIFYLGPRVKPFLEKYLAVISFLIVALTIALILLTHMAAQ